MLSFAAEFPVDGNFSTADFICAVRSWILDSPHTTFTEEKLAEILSCGESSVDSKNHKVDALSITANGEESAAIKHTITQDGIEWLTTAVFSKRVSDTWVSVRTSRESHHAIAHLPQAKKPILVRVLLETLSGGHDGELRVSQLPRRLTNNEISLAGRLITGQAGCHLPVVYISASFDGVYTVDANSLAYELSGMAHVVVEPNRPFSRRLQIDVSSENVYGGNVGIYWPHGAGSKKFHLGTAGSSITAFKRSIEEEVRAAMLNRRPLFRCTWSAVQEASSRNIYEALKASGSMEVEKYTVAFDSEIKAKEEKLSDAEKEIARLERELRKYEAKLQAASGVGLNTGSEQDLYEDEIRQVVLDALADAKDRAQDDSRRKHVISAIVKSNETKETARDYRTKLKQILRDYRSMDNSVRRRLEEMGFSISEDGKHYKLVFREDERYTFVLAKSGSDHRGGLNATSDISKRLF